MSASQLASNLNSVIVTPLITLLIATGLLIFLWGLVEFLMGLSSNNESKENGKRHMLWGIIGMTVMVAAAAILRIIAATVGSNVIH